MDLVLGKWPEPLFDAPLLSYSSSLTFPTPNLEFIPLSLKGLHIGTGCSTISLFSSLSLIDTMDNFPFSLLPYLCQRDGGISIYTA